jgi:hypothetical protein
MIIFPTTDGRKFYQLARTFRIGRTYVSTENEKSQRFLAKSKIIISIEG